jgi:antirestriction protein
MRNEAVIKREGMKVLAENLGIVEAEKFLMLLSRERFDYTAWQRDLYGDASVEELYGKIKRFEEFSGPREKMSDKTGSPV